jgi:hypothetical protein
MGTTNRSIQQRQGSRIETQNRLVENLPTSVQKGYFMLSMPSALSSIPLSGSIKLASLNRFRWEEKTYSNRHCGW